MKIYCTDTDRFHFNENVALRLYKVCEETQERPLTGKHIGQFQCGFDFKGVDDARYIVMAVLDTKYIDKLEGTCKDANEQYSYHMILRGT